jgi:hypothetical protein
MLHHHSRLLGTIAAAVLAAAAFGVPLAGAGGGNTYSGQATVVRATVLGLQPIVLADTGPLPSSGGAQDATLLTASVPGLLTAEVLHAATVAQGDHSRSEASVANVGLTVAGNRIAADFLASRASADCSSGSASAGGSSEIIGLVVNGKNIAVSGQPNQTVMLPGGGQLIINEQTSSPGSITVNALHVTIPGVADIVVSSAHADIACQSPPPPPPPTCNSSDFVTGGGWIAPASSKDNFAVAGGIKNAAFWGHLTYIDHGANGPTVKGTGVTAYKVTGPTSRHIEGTAEVNGQSGFTFKVDVADNGEPGRTDTFSLKLSNGYSASGMLDGGNIQLHNPCT